MSKQLYLYLWSSVDETKRLVKVHQEEFEVLLGDTFGDEEITRYERMLDEMGSVEVQPILSELTFDDFYFDPLMAIKQRPFFESCQSCICLDNLPFLEGNPFQVTYLIDLLWILDETLVDRGGVSELVFKKYYLEELKKFKGIDSIQGRPEPKKNETVTSAPIHPIDFLALDVYKEIGRLKEVNVDVVIDEDLIKMKKIFLLMRDQKLDVRSLLNLSGLIPKDFEDNLEKLKFYLRRF